MRSRSVIQRGIILAVLLLACEGRAVGRLRVAASTSIVGDIVATVGGTNVEVAVIYPRGADPHAFEPAPRDLAGVSRCALVFFNGLGLEGRLTAMLEGALGDKSRMVCVSDGVKVRALTDAEHDDHDHGQGDPHVWFDPMLVAAWSTNIAAALAKADPANAGGYADRRDALVSKLGELDAWIRAETAKLPAARRVLVTDHDSFGYYAARYNFRIVGAVLPGFSSLAEPSARDLVALQRAVRDARVPAIFVGAIASQERIARLTQDLKVRIVTIQTCSLGAAGSGAETYIDFMHSVTRTFVDALRETPP